MNRLTEARILMGMPDATTIRVSSETRDQVRALAEADGVTMDEMIRRLTRWERQRRIGVELASYDYDDDDERWLELGAETIRDHAGG